MGIRGCFKGRQQSKSPETQVSVAGHRGWRVEPGDEGPSQESAEIPDGPSVGRDSLTGSQHPRLPAGEQDDARARAREKNQRNVDIDPCRGHQAAPRFYRSWRRGLSGFSNPIRTLTRDPMPSGWRG